MLSFIGSCLPLGASGKFSVVRPTFNWLLAEASCKREHVVWNVMGPLHHFNLVRVKFDLIVRCWLCKITNTFEERCSWSCTISIANVMIIGCWCMADAWIWVNKQEQSSSYYTEYYKIIYTMYYTYFHIPSGMSAVWLGRLLYLIIST